MATIGNISVPQIPNSGLSWPLVSDFGYIVSQPTSTISHRFGGLAEKSYQVFSTGFGARKFAFKASRLSWAQRNSLINFFESIQEGGLQYFIYNAPNADGKTFTPVNVIFEQGVPVSLAQLETSCSTGFNFVEIITATQSYTASSICLRFPNSGMNTALLNQEQTIIPLIHIRVIDSTIPDIYLSDRNVTITGTGSVPSTMGWGSGSQQYQPRIVTGNNDYILSQSISTSGGKADNVSFSLGNGDRVMTALSNSTDLKYASVDLCLFHVQSNTILQLWKGFIQDYQSDGTAIFSINCSDGLYPVFQLYPTRLVSRFCQNTFDDGATCPYSLVSRPSTVPLVTGQQVSTFTSVNGTTTVGQANASLCSYLYDDPYNASEPNVSPGGCVAHGMYQYFGGHPLTPQSIQIHDKGNSGNLVTSTSIVSDTAAGSPLPEIWCNQGANPLNAYVANGIMYDYRDESTYADGGAIIGAGPLGAYTIVDRGGTQPNGPFTPGNGGEYVLNPDTLQIQIAPTLDGTPCFGFKANVSGSGTVSYQTNSNAGLRQAFGYTPIPPTDEGYNQFGLTQDNSSPGTAATVYNATYAAGNSPMQFAAGTALVEIRIQKAAGQGIAPSVPESHSIAVPIAQGLMGYQWDYTGGTRTAQIGCTNPFWIAVNSYLRCLSLYNNTASATQLEQFVLSSLVNADGVSGTADIANLSVPTLVGSGSETQFQFQGTIGSATSNGGGGRRPFRDYLQEILNCGLGYYTFEFGKLKLGIRENASAVQAFTVGNMLYQSLSLHPIQAAFEMLTYNFANVAYQFQGDQAYYFDRDHARYYGRGNAPLSSTMNSIGICTMSQGLRCAATRVREEVGGVWEKGIETTPLEWKAARVANWGTTILALDTEVGQVVSVTHPDVPGGYNPDTWVQGVGPGTDGWINGKSYYRIQSWKLKKDWSIEVTAQTVTPSMYDLDYGPKPKSVPVPSLKVLFYPQSQGQWQPHGVQAPSTDSLFPNEWNMAVTEAYTTNADGSANASLTIGSVLPVNQFLNGCAPPTIGTASATISTTGGTIPGGSLMRVAVIATGSTAGTCSPPSDIIFIQIPTGTNTNKFTLNNIQWPQYQGLTGYTLFASTSDDLMCSQVSGSLTASGSPATIYTPTSVSCTAVARTGYELPNPNIANVLVRGKLGRHFGVAGFQIDSVGTNTIVSNEAIDTTGHDNWTGRIIAIIGRPESTIPFVSYTCTAFNPSSGTFTLNETVSSTLQAGDVGVICFAGYDNSATPTVFTDAGLVNAINTNEGFPGGGLQSEVGRVFRVWAGTSRGTTANIVSNTGTSVTLDAQVLLDATSVIIIEDQSWVFESPSTAVANSNLFTTASLTLPVSNMIHQPVVLAGFTQDVNGVLSPDDGRQPIRLGWISGVEGNIFVTTQTENWQAALDSTPQNGSYPS